MASKLPRKAAGILQARLYSAAAQQRQASGTSFQQPPKLSRLPNGLTVASINTQWPVSRVSLVANAGSRFEDGDNLGVTHCLRLAAGLSTKQSTCFNITRTLEQAGAEFTCSSTREYMFYKIDCLRDHLQLVTEILNEVITAPSFKPWELSALADNLRHDLAKVHTMPNVLVYDLLHQAAYRDTLGRSLYSPSFMVDKFSPEQLMHFVKGYYSTGRLALVGVGVDHEELVKCAEQFSPFSAANIGHDKARYYGGEIRQDTGGELTYAALAFEGPSVSGKGLLYAAVLQNILGIGPNIKYSSAAAASPLSKAVTLATTEPVAIKCINANYTDGGLFGFYVITTPKEMDKVLCAACKQFEATLTGGIDEKEVARAKKQLKAQIALYRESCDALVYDLGEQCSGGSELLTTQHLLRLVDSVSTSDVAQLASSLLEGKPTMAAMGNLSTTPYLDRLLP